MPAWEEYKATAKARGALALELYVVQSQAGDDPAAIQANLPDHLEYQRRMEAEGRLVMAGPVSDESGDNMFGSGQIVYRAASMEEAKALADGDPMHKSGARSYSLRKWLVNEGSLNVSVGLSTGHVALS